MKIYLIGYMGSGKSSVGKKLASKLGLDFIDLDSLMEKDEGTTISEIFEKEGEVKFRWLERNALKKTIVTFSDAVIATGGGTPCFQNNMDLMNKTGFTVFLEMEANALFDRLQNAKDPRPLIRNLSENELKLYISSQLLDRNPYYYKAKLSVSGINMDINSLAESIKSLY